MRRHGGTPSLLEQSLEDFREMGLTWHEHQTLARLAEMRKPWWVSSDQRGLAAASYSVS